MLAILSTGRVFSKETWAKWIKEWQEEDIVHVKEREAGRLILRVNADKLKYYSEFAREMALIKHKFPTVQYKRQPIKFYHYPRGFSRLKRVVGLIGNFYKKIRNEPDWDAFLPMSDFAVANVAALLEMGYTFRQIKAGMVEIMKEPFHQETNLKFINMDFLLNPERIQIALMRVHENEIRPNEQQGIEETIPDAPSAGTPGSSDLPSFTWQDDPGD